MARATENSLESFLLAERCGADELELDVRATADGVPIVLHDHTLRRLAGGPSPVLDVPVSELSLDLVRQVILVSGLPAPTLAEVMRATGIPLQVEIKAVAAIPAVATLLAAESELQSRIRFTSFLPDALSLLKLHLPHIPRGLIIPSFPVTGKKVHTLNETLLATGASFLNCGFDGLTVAAVDYLHARDLLVNVWPLTGPDEVARALDLGADGGTADDPLAARQWRDALEAASHPAGRLPRAAA
jgi:glycerophosphoryl diester phosphodiesterase